jgi:hypothetical protein
MHPRSLRLTILALLTSACAADSLDTLWPAAPSDGPRVVYDLAARPLPVIPFPIDTATRADPDSPTGRRVNASVVAPTLLEADVRAEMSLLDGFGTFSPITVSFSAAIDPNDVRQRHLDDALENDAVYVIDLVTGEPAALDLGRGAYPATVFSSNNFFDNDPRSLGSSLLYETQPEDVNGNGRLDPGEDTNFDGVLGVPNTVDPRQPLRGAAFRPRDAAAKRGNDVYRDLLSHYERASHTLVIRPLVPLEQQRPYAVVLTRRITDERGRPIASPFEGVCHAAQVTALAPLRALVDAGRIPGLTRSDVAFAWAFTTQTVTRDLEQIREGLHGRGPLARLSTQFPARLETVAYADPKRAELEQVTVRPLVDDPKKAGAKNRYTLPPKQLTGVIENLLPVVNPDWSGGGADLLIESYKFVDYIVMGSFASPDFLDDPDRPTYDAVFRVNPDKGLARVWQRPDDWARLEAEALEASLSLAPNSPEMMALWGRTRRAIRDRITFMLFVPKPRPAEGVVAPFPVALYGHGYGSASFEALGFAGNFAKFGIATVAINDYGHGLPLSPVLRAAVVSLLQQYGIGPMAQAILDGRARDLNHDGTDDSGGDFWVANAFHTRDVVRQSVVDHLQLVRVLQAFGTYEIGDLNGDGIAEKAGDFDADGTIDVGGPGVDYFAFGQSLGGIVTAIVSAVEPAIVAAAPVAAAGGLADVGVRTELGRVNTAVFLEVFGPFLHGRPREGGGTDLYLQALDVDTSARLPLNAEPLDIRPGDEVVVTNVSTDEGEPLHDRYVVGRDGRFRLHVAADGPSFADDSPYDDAPVRVGACEDPSTLSAEAARLHLLRPADCLVFKVIRDGVEVLSIDRFPRDVTFQHRRFPQGSPLVAVARGLGHKRQTPSFRRLISLTASVLDPADPANYAKHYFLDPLPARRGNPLAVLIGGVAGDSWVPVSTAYSLGRSAGVIPYRYDESKHAAWGMSPNDVLIRTGALEGIEQLRYYLPAARAAADPRAPVDPADADLVRLVACPKAKDCENAAVLDVGVYARHEDTGALLDEGNDVFAAFGGAPRLRTPLREATTAAFRATGRDGREVERKSAFLFPYVEPAGRHGFDIPHEHNPFDVELYMVNMIGQYFRSRGTELHYETCMHRDGYDRRRKEEGRTRDQRCAFIPDYPVDF